MAQLKIPAAAGLTLFVLGNSLAQAQSVSCTCRYKGQDYGIGESICLKSPDGLRMATCGMVLNNTSWQFSNAPCPLTQLQQTGGTGLLPSGLPFLKQTPWQQSGTLRASI
ncbi:hypothetical protein [Roseibium sp. M-1]